MLLPLVFTSCTSLSSLALSITPPLSTVELMCTSSPTFDPLCVSSTALPLLSPTSSYTFDSSRISSLTGIALPLSAVKLLSSESSSTLDPSWPKSTLSPQSTLLPLPHCYHIHCFCCVLQWKDSLCHFHCAEHCFHH